MTDDELRKRTEDPAHGRWRDTDGKRVFTPNPSFFDGVDPMELAKYFDKSEKELLNLT